MSNTDSRNAAIALTSRLVQRLGPAIVFVVMATFFFGESFWRNEQFVFRDAAHFYYPLFHEVARQWKQGEIPLWSPWDGVGMPLAADATSSVFYPGKLLLLGPWGFDHGLRLYVVGHYLLAYWGMYKGARVWHCSRSGACLAAVSYALGGPLLSYHSNVVFLVGAAWLPWALASGWRLIRRPEVGAAVWLAVCLALMVLGGDPQLAYHVTGLLILGALFFALPFRHGSWNRWLLRRGWRSGAVAASAALALALAAVQILPSSGWSARSERSASQAPRNIYELTAALAKSPGRGVEWDALLARADARSHLRHSYDFSIGPWSWPETFWPGFSGSMYPQNQRWLKAIPAEGRVWFASLFVGTWTVVLAAVGLGHRPWTRLDRWMLSIAAVGMLASLGWYGLGWLVQEFGYVTAWYDIDNLPVGSPFGGLYWLMTVVLPQYVSFRYPAKWWIIVSLVLALLAARGLDRTRQMHWNRHHLVLSGLAFLSLGIGAAIYAAAERLGALLPATPTDGLFGPLDAAGGIRLAAGGLVQAAVILLIGTGLVRYGPRYWIGGSLVVLLGVDLAIAHHAILPTAPVPYWRTGPPPQHLPTPTADDPLPGVYRSRAIDFYPRHFASNGSEERQLEGLRIDRQTLFPRYHLLEPVRAVPSVVSIMPADYQTLWEGATTAEAGKLLRDMLGAHNHFRETPDQTLEVRDRPAPWPAAFFQNHVTWRAPPAKNDPEILRQDAQQLLQQLTNYDGDERPVVLETVSSNDHPGDAAGETSPSAPLHYRRLASGSIGIELSRPSSGWVIIREFYDPNWRCRITTTSGEVKAAVPIYRANRVLMGVRVSEEDRYLRLDYWPVSFVWGLCVSSVAWILVVILAAMRLRQG